MTINKGSNGSLNPNKYSPDHIVEYFKTHTRETASYVLLVLGILLLILDFTLYGGVLVGIVAGIYFGDELVSFISNFRVTFSSQGVAKNIILGGVGLAFLISAPAIFLGMGISIGIKQLFLAKS
jgi:hypothetical protein